VHGLSAMPVRRGHVRESIPGTNVPKDKKYDQIAFRARQGRLEVKGAGMFDYYEHVFTTDDERTTAAISTPTSRSNTRRVKSHHSRQRTRRPLLRSTGSGGPIRCLITCRCGPSRGSTLLTTTCASCQSNKCPETF
jgi:hypothetical protein